MLRIEGFPQIPASAGISAEAVAIVHPRSLSGSRALDFFLLGGASLLLWTLIFFGQERFGPLATLAGVMPTTAALLAHFINHPHFMASYKLAYDQGGAFIARHPFQLVIVPAVLILWPVLAAMYWGANVGLARPLGPWMLSGLISCMYFTVGWHYAKQAFGAMMVYARFDGYPLSSRQRLVIRLALLSTWWLTWTYGNTTTGTYPFFSLQVERLGLPRPLFYLACLVAGALLVLTIGVFISNIVKRGAKPSLNLLIPMIALYLWHVPLFIDPAFFVIIAFFHSLQYLPFVYKVEAARSRGKSRRWAHAAGYVLLMILTGFLAFESFPNNLDPWFDTKARLGVEFFTIATLAFINIHHYFIDNVLWRFKNAQVRDYLLT